VVLLPVDSRPRTAPVSAASDFALVSPEPTFDLLAAEVVASVERLHPGEEGGRLQTDSASGARGTDGTVLVRRHGLPDDSLAGYEYTVTAAQRTEGWIVVSATKETICRRGVTDNLCV